MLVIDYLNSIGLHKAEGGSEAFQTQWFSDWFASHPEVTQVLEIGFNTGCWSECVLKSRPDIWVTSVDIGNHPYIVPAHEFLQKTYGRHELVLGDSTKTIPKINKKYDAVFIDGGHFTPVPYKDIINCKALSHPNTTLFIDDFDNFYGREVFPDFQKAEREGHIEPGWTVTRQCELTEDFYKPCWFVGKYHF